MSPISANLTRLRREKGLTQSALAESAELSLAGYRKVEKGQSEPRPETIEALARALRVPLRALVEPVPTLERVRFRSFKKLRTREGILSDVAVRLADFNSLEDLTGERIAYRLADLGSQTGEVAPGGEEGPEGLARAVRKRFRLSQREPIRDICGLLSAHGIKVLPFEVASDAFFGLSVALEDGGPAVVVNTWPRISVERWIFTAVHELGHLLLHREDYDVRESAEEQRREKEANAFASHFLMPEEVFWDEWSETAGMPLVDRVLKVKRMFRVSYKTVLYRLSERMEEPSAIWPRFQVAYRRVYGRTLAKEDEPSRLRADTFDSGFPEASRAGEPENLSRSDFLEDRLHWLVRRAVEREEISLSRGAEILRIPLREMRELAASWIEA